MVLRRIISGVTFTNKIGAALPDIPGVLALGFFGSGGDGINTNRASGGPAFATIGNAPLISASYMSVGLFGVKATATANAPSGGQILGYTVTAGGSQYTQAPPSILISGGGGTSAAATATVGGGAVTALTPSNNGSGYTTAPTVTLGGGNFSGMDSGVTRASVLAGGWSAIVVARVPSAGAGSALVDDLVSTTSTGFNFLMQMRQLDGLHGSGPTVSYYQGGTERLFHLLPSAATNWRMVGYTYSGGATGTATLYNLSENPTPVTFISAAVSAAASQKMHFGPHTNSAPGATNTADIAFGCVAAGVLSASFLQTQLAPAVKAILAQRNIVVL